MKAGSDPCPTKAITLPPTEFVTIPMTEWEYITLMRGDGSGRNVRGLLSETVIPQGKMTRQRRRQEERAKAKGR